MTRTNTRTQPNQMRGRVPADAIEFFAEPAEEAPQANEPHPNFIEANTHPVTLEGLEETCIIPTFADNSLTVSHQNFVKSVLGAAQTIYGELSPVELRVSHPVHGRKPEAIYKKQSELTEEDKTLFYERMAFISKIPSLKRNINGQEVALTIGGVRSYSEDRLYSRPAPQHFKIFVGWQVRVCSNLMLTCDGLKDEIECMTEADLYQKAGLLFNEFNQIKDRELEMLQKLNDTKISEEQFTHIIGRLRLYQFLPTDEQRRLPKVILGDQAINNATNGYVNNPNFGRKEGEDISCWNLMQLLNEAAKQSYIDKWLQRNQNATDFSLGIQMALEGTDTQGYSWFLN